MNLHKTLRTHIDDFQNISSNGVYMIYHISKPHSVYIGSTFRSAIKNCKKGMYGRWVEHMLLIKKNKHHSPKLQNLFNKYGLEGIRFKSIFPCDECSEIEIREKEFNFINLYNSFQNGLNCSSDTFHQSMSLVEREKSSIRMKNNNPMRNETSKKKMIKSLYESSIEPVLVFTKEGLLIGEFPSTQFVADFLNRNVTNVYRACIGEFKSSGNHIIIYKKDYSIKELKKRVFNCQMNKKASKESVFNRTQKQNKKVKISKFEFSEIFDSIKKAGELLQLDKAAISKCCNGTQRTTKGYYCEFV